MLKVIACVFFAGILHEFGHWLASDLVGKPITEWNWNIKSFWRVTWKYPAGLSLMEKRFIAFAGFAFEFLLAIPVGGILLKVALLHLVAYPFYCGNACDYKVFLDKK